jgi:phenylacetate-coenzyme A ligase PaaK-like adenylate-forming protein
MVSDRICLVVSVAGLTGHRWNLDVRNRMKLEASLSTTASPDDFAIELVHRLAAVESIDPVALADLFRYAGGHEEHKTTLRHVLQKFLLTRTLDHARQHTTYYRQHDYDDWVPSADRTAPDLNGVPLLRRETVVEHFDDFLADDVTVRSVCHTSGTTGIPLNLYKSYEEIRFIQAYYRRLFQPVIKSLKLQPLVLTLPNVNHGVPVPMPGIGMTFVAGVTDDTLIQDAARVLQSTFRIKGHDSRISILSGLPHHVLLLTSYLMEQNINPRDLKLSGVTVTGGFLAMNWFQFLVDAWGCIINDRFTLTEAIGGASRIHGTDIFELDPHLVGEVVDLDTEQQADDAVGLLVLTNLYPFVQMQPLIRYTVGDLIRRVPSPGPLRFQFLGKARNCISWMRDGRREWLLFSARLNELVNQFPDVNITEWFSNIRVVYDRTIGSLPVLSVTAMDEGDRLSILISIELRYAPHTRRTRVNELRQTIIEGLRATLNTALAVRLDRGEVVLDIAFFGPDALKAPLVIKI